MIWRSKDDSGRNINIFIRPMFTTLEDRNLITFSADAGLTMHEPIVGRGDDTAGLCVGVARVSSGASGYDKDLEFYEPAVYTPVHGTETFIEGTYQIQATKWLQIQPDIQYVFNPGAAGDSRSRNSVQDFRTRPCPRRFERSAGPRGPPARSCGPSFSAFPVPALRSPGVWRLARRDESHNSS